MLLSFQLLSQNPQELTLERCYTQARQNYPLIRQNELILKTQKFTLDNLTKTIWPQLSVNGQATYQSDVTKLDIKLPNVATPVISNDQYRIYAELSQSLTDPLLLKQQKEWTKASFASETEKMEVELYKVKERIHQMYFSILLLEEQIRQSEWLEKDVSASIKKMEAAIANGVAIPSGLDVLVAERLKVQQRFTELQYARRSYLDILGAFMNQSLSDSTILVKPAQMAVTNTMNRPELKWFEAQKWGVTQHDQFLKTKTIPKVSLFVQGGYGRPALNMLDNAFKTYYIGGLRFNWNLSAFYVYAKERQLQDINRQSIDVQKEVFLFNTQTQLKQQSGEINKLNELLNTDEELIRLRERIKQTAREQMEKGILTATDYLIQSNAEDQARQNKALHATQLLMAQYNYLLTTGN